MANRSFRRALAGLCLAGAFVASQALTASQILAQQAPAQPAAPAPAPAAPLPPLPATQLALARSVMDASGITSSFDPLISNVASQLLVLYTKKRPQNVNDFEEIIVAMKPDLEAKKKELLVKAVDVYARKLDEPTLKTILAFLQSPAGVKYTTVLPQVLNEVADATDNWSKDVATFMANRIVDEMKKKGVDLGR
ncbi:hypothetical protein SAMN05444161_4643 [Rhizobiales bacterium GAS191]|nr:hypothetical protein SAMN05444161_4643 [Rhizobiales bacterium GAS191]